MGETQGMVENSSLVDFSILQKLSQVNGSASIPKLESQKEENTGIYLSIPEGNGSHICNVNTTLLHTYIKSQY